MPDDKREILVALFSTRRHADLAREELRREGYRDEQFGQVWLENGNPCGTGELGSGVGGDVAAHLGGLGVSPEPAGYYAREVATGLCLLLITGASPQARVAIGRHCGSARIPEDPAH